MKVELKGISHSFDGEEVLSDINLEVRDGEMLGILGPSGCGKTTILRIVAGLIRPNSGGVLFDGKDVTDVPPEKRNVGMVFQSYALFPHLNVEENIGFGLAVRGKRMDEIRKRVKDLLELVRLEGYEKRRIDELSGGEMQRVALARALAPGVDILLLDEPLAALDAKLRNALKKEIRRIQRETGVTAIYVTHDQEEALSISDRVAVMSRGKIEQIGRPVEIYMHPETEFVARFVGEINMLDGIVKGGSIETPVGSIPAGTDFSEGEIVKILIRPENLLPFEKGECMRIRGKIVEMESAAGEIRGKIKVNGAEMMLRRYIGEIDTKIGDEVELYIPLDRISFMK